MQLAHINIIRVCRIKFLYSRRPTDLRILKGPAAMRLVGADVSGCFRFPTIENTSPNPTSSSCRTEGECPMHKYGIIVCKCIFLGVRLLSNQGRMPAAVYIMLYVGT